MVRQVALCAFVVALLHAPVHAKGPNPVRVGTPPPATPATPAPEPASAVAAKDIIRLAPPLECDRVTITEGLPNSHVHAIVQDKLGFMWFGTGDGLARYDGSRMRVYRPIEKDATSISSGVRHGTRGRHVRQAVGRYVGARPRPLRSRRPTSSRGSRRGRARSAPRASPHRARRQGPDVVRDERWRAQPFDPSTTTFIEYTAKPLDIAVTAIDCRRSPATSGSAPRATVSSGGIPTTTPR